MQKHPPPHLHPVTEKSDPLALVALCWPCAIKVMMIIIMARVEWPRKYTINTISLRPAAWRTSFHNETLISLLALSLCWKNTLSLSIREGQLHTYCSLSGSSGHGAHDYWDNFNNPSVPDATVRQSHLKRCEHFLVKKQIGSPKVLFKAWEFAPALL